jgi:NAD(P)H-flavin reductase
MSDWFDATVVGKKPSGTGLCEVDLDVAGTPVPDSHTRAGQYVKLSLDGKGESYFAIASAPSERGSSTVVEFLIKAGAPLADAILALPVGGKVRISQAQGKGFPIEEAVGRRVLLFATGSGISAVRSLIGLIRRDRSRYGPVTLYFGVRTPDAFAYQLEVDSWLADDIALVRTVSRPGETGWTGLTGYVQAHVADERLDDAVAFLCGQKQMVNGVTEALKQRGLPAGRLFLNF